MKSSEDNGYDFKDNEFLLSKMEEMQKTIEALQKQNQTLTEENDKLKNTNDLTQSYYEEEAQELKNKAEQVYDQTQNLTKTLEREYSSSKTREADIQRLEKQAQELEKVKDANQELTREVEKLSNKVKSQEGEIIKYEKYKKHDDETITRLNQEALEKENQNKALEEQNLSRENLLQEKDKEIEALNKDKKSLNAQIDELETKNGELKGEKEKLAKDLSDADRSPSFIASWPNQDDNNDLSEITKNSTINNDECDFRGQSSFYIDNRVQPQAHKAQELKPTQSMQDNSSKDGVKEYKSIDPKEVDLKSNKEVDSKANKAVNLEANDEWIFLTDNGEYIQKDAQILQFSGDLENKTAEQIIEKHP